jgi:hypothetical protein
VTSDVPTSRGFFGYGCDVLAGIASALILGFALAHPASILVLLSYAAAIPLFIIGFGYGARSSLIAASVGIVAIAAAAPMGVTILYFLTDALPAALLVWFALRPRMGHDGNIEWPSEGKLFTLLMLYPCILFLIIVAITMGQAGGLYGQTVHVLDGATDQVITSLSASGQAITPEVTLKVQHYLAFLAHIAPSVAMVTWLLITILALVAAQAVLPPLGLGIRPAFALENLCMPNGIIFALLVCAGASFAPAPFDYVALNLAILLSVPFFFTGLAVVHAGAAQTRYALPLLIVFYILIAYLLPLVAVIGAVDPWANFRKKFAARQKPII